ncbi:transcription termination factor NusA [Coprothermobacteraceae bacterium]|nr:transcription termination factor NusA [Coprothermobacteraceae bacterium]
MEGNAERNKAIAKALSEYVQQLAKDLELSSSEILDALKDALSSAVRKELGIPKEELQEAVRIQQEDGSMRILVRKQYAPEALGVAEDEWVEFPLSALTRVSIQTAENTLKNRIAEKRKEKAMRRIAHLAGEVVTAKVVRRDPKSKIVFADVEGVECVIEPSEQIPNDRYLPGESLRCLVLGVGNVPSLGQNVRLSRAAAELLKVLFELEIPEVGEGVVRIMGIARKPGRRSKVAVMSFDPRLDPQGACIGYKGQRIQAISRSLANEKIDVVKWDNDPAKLIANVLSPGKVESVEIVDSKKKVAVAYALPENIKVVVGEDGENVELAQQLTGWVIDVREGGVAYED